MIYRTAEKEVKQLAIHFKAVAIVGPRQSGKTTLARYVFPDKPYISLENPDMRSFAETDPRGFLSQFPQGAILDEAQRTPELFSYLQQILDESSETGQFIITGSNNFLLQESITQSLAGRIAYLFLLPFSTRELKAANLLPDEINDVLFSGGYPPIYDHSVPPEKWHPNYIRTYLERDVRQLKNISDLNAFERFIRLCAGRTGQLLNMNSLGTDAGIDHKTVASWLSVLEASFIIHLLRPYYRNFNKRVVKAPKLYFYDTGLVCALLGLQKSEELTLHYLKGNLFENFVVSELIKSRYNTGKQHNLYFWRDNTGNEIDVLIEEGEDLFPVEIKSGKTVTADYFRGLEFWRKLTGIPEGTIVYGGDIPQKRSSGINIRPWRSMQDL